MTDSTYMDYRERERYEMFMKVYEELMASPEKRTEFFEKVGFCDSDGKISKKYQRLFPETA